MFVLKGFWIRGLKDGKKRKMIGKKIIVVDIVLSWKFRRIMKLRSSDGRGIKRDDWVLDLKSE